MTALPLIETARLAFAAFVIALGLVCMFGGAIGLLRFPDFYTRLHAAGVADSIGSAIVVAGLAISAQSGSVALRLLLFGALIVALSPVFAHLAGSGAHAGGLAPIAGRYASPRPGAARKQEPSP